MFFLKRHAILIIAAALAPAIFAQSAASQSAASRYALILEDRSYYCSDLRRARRSNQPMAEATGNRSKPSSEAFAMYWRRDTLP